MTLRNSMCAEKSTLETSSRYIFPWGSGNKWPSNVTVSTKGGPRPAAPAETCITVEPKHINILTRHMHETAVGIMSVSAVSWVQTLGQYNELMTAERRHAHSLGGGSNSRQASCIEALARDSTLRIWCSLSCRVYASCSLPWMNSI